MGLGPPCLVPLGSDVPCCTPSSESVAPGNQHRDTSVQMRGGRQIEDFIC